MNLLSHLKKFLSDTFNKKISHEEIWKNSTDNLQDIKKTISSYEANTLKEKDVTEELIRPDPNINRIKEIEKFIIDRDIKYLIHFTRIENLPHILKNGLLGKIDIKHKNIYSITNDELRLDNIDNAICTSISFPNYKMFYKLQKQNIQAKWAILKLDASLIYKIDAAFCYTNAASNHITGIPLNQLRSIQALEEMFDEKIKGISRSQLNIPKNFTTDPQAEVIFLEKISASYIKEICLANQSNIPPEYIDDFNFSVDLSLFGPRSDYSFWQNK